MLKITAIVSLMLIGSTMWAASLSCDSCGSECASACGTRQFRSCCFNYLRRKRGPDAAKLIPQTINEIREVKEKKLPVFVDNSDLLYVLPEYRRYDDFERLFDV